MACFDFAKDMGITIECQQKHVKYHPIIISHLCPALFCVHASFEIIPFPVSTLHLFLYFGYFISLFMSFELISHT